MNRKERAIRLELAYELISNVHSDLARGDEEERHNCQDPKWMAVLRDLIYLSRVVEKPPKMSRELLRRKYEELRKEQAGT